MAGDRYAQAALYRGLLTVGIIDYHSPLNILISVKGHPFERDAFAAVFESFEGIRHTFVEQPASQNFFNPDAAEPWDVLVFYDMPGIDFSTQPPRLGAAIGCTQARLDGPARLGERNGISAPRDRRLAALAGVRRDHWRALFLSAFGVPRSASAGFRIPARCQP